MQQERTGILLTLSLGNSPSVLPLPFRRVANIERQPELSDLGSMKEASHRRLQLHWHSAFAAHALRNDSDELRSSKPC